MVLIDDRSVVQDVEQLFFARGVGNLGDEDLDLHRLHLVGEGLSEHLRVVVREAPSLDVLTAVREALQVSVAHAGDTKLVELVVFAHTCEGNLVVDLRDLVQCR